MENNNKITYVKNNYVFIVFTIALILGIILLTITFINSTNQSSKIYYPEIEKPIKILNVALKGSDGSIEEVSLPVRKDNMYSYSYDFIVHSDKNHMRQCVNVHSHFSSFIIRHSDEIIYKSQASDNASHSSMAFFFDIINIPDKYLDKKLTIEFTSLLPKDNNLSIPSILIGTKNGIRKHFFYSELFTSLSSVALLITAIFITIIGLFFIRIGQTSKNLFIGVSFIIEIALYTLFKSCIVLYYLDNNILIYFMEYTCLMLLPITIHLIFLSIMDEYELNDWRTKSFKLIIIVSFINLISQWILTITELSEFILMEKFTFFILIASSVFLAISILTVDNSIIHEKNQIVLSLAPMLILITSIFVGNYNKCTVSTIPTIIISSIIFLLIHFVLVLKKYVQEYNLAIEDEFYGQLAYFDTLTQLSNRHDLERTIKAIENKNITFKTLYILMLDMNNLKEINDNYGHKYGDTYLKTAANVLLSIEKKYPSVKAYRYGGDEFIMLCYNKKIKEIEKLIIDINKLSKARVIDGCEYKLDFAAGYSVCTNQDFFDINKLKEEADKLMYENKSLKKAGKVHER